MLKKNSICRVITHLQAWTHVIFFFMVLKSYFQRLLHYIPSLCHLLYIRTYSFSWLNIFIFICSFSCKDVKTLFTEQLLCFVLCIWIYFTMVMRNILWGKKYHVLCLLEHCCAHEDGMWLMIISNSPITLSKSQLERTRQETSAHWLREGVCTGAVSVCVYRVQEVWLKQWTSNAHAWCFFIWDMACVRTHLVNIMVPTYALYNIQWKKKFAPLLILDVCPLTKKWSVYNCNGLFEQWETE